MLASTVLPGGGAIALLLCGSVYVLSPSAGALVLGFIDSGFTLLASQSCSLPANQWTRISFAATLTSLLPVRLLIGGLNSWNGPLSLFGAQVSPLGAAGAYVRTPGNYGVHSSVRFDTDPLVPQYVGPGQIALKLRLTEHA
jgi:hypothetical protein